MSTVAGVSGLSEVAAREMEANLPAWLEWSSPTAERERAREIEGEKESNRKRGKRVKLKRALWRLRVMYNDMHRPNEHSIISLYICLCPISHACAECKLPEIHRPLLSAHRMPLTLLLLLMEASRA